MRPDKRTRDYLLWRLHTCCRRFSHYRAVGMSGEDVGRCGADLYRAFVHAKWTVGLAPTCGVLIANRLSLLDFLDYADPVEP